MYDEDMDLEQMLEYLELEREYQREMQLVDMMDALYGTSEVNEEQFKQIILIGGE